MAGEDCAAAETGEATAAAPQDVPTPVPVFLVPALDDSRQRREVLTKVQEFLTAESLESPEGMTYLGQVGWEEVGQVCSLACHLLSVCRTHRLLPSERCILLSLHDQYQAIQLCLARINKVRQGEFMAAASDVLDVWNAMYKETVSEADPSEAEAGTLEELKHLRTSQESCDPMKREMQEVIRDYREFLADSLCVDHFKVFESVRGLLRDNPVLFREVFSKVCVIEGLEQLPLMERALLKLISEGSQVYRVSPELPFLDAAPPSPSTLDISGIHENNMQQTPGRHDGRQTDSTLHDSRDTLSPQTPSQHDKQQTVRTTNNPKDTSTPGKPVLQVDKGDCKNTHNPGNTVIHVERVEESLTEIVDGAPRYLAKVTVSSESEAYIERLFLAHVRLLVNTRDELALTLACSMPGREIGHQGFTDIRQEAQRKEMPMYQTIVSFILRRRLGGKGYQPEPNNPVLPHANPLGEFVDALMKLQNILEAQTDARQGAARVLSGIKTGLGKMKGCMLKRTVIEAVADRLSVALGQLMEAAETDSNTCSGPDTTGHHKPSNLHPSLKHLIRLCDVAGGQAYTGGVVDALGGDLLTQLSSSKKVTQTPVRVPSVLSLFRSPAQVINEEEEKGVEEDLETRIKRKMGKATTDPTEPKRYKSECLWAPIDMSPIDTEKLNLSFASPITGPSLKVMGKTARHSSESWREILASVKQGEDLVPSPCRSTCFPSKPASPATTKAPKAGDNSKPKKSRSKRSLLKDISNMGIESGQIQGKKQKLAAGEKEGAKPRKEPKTKALLKGQRSIISFFKT